MCSGVRTGRGLVSEHATLFSPLHALRQHFSQGGQASLVLKTACSVSSEQAIVAFDSCTWLLWTMPRLQCWAVTLTCKGSMNKDLSSCTPFRLAFTAVPRCSRWLLAHLDTTSLPGRGTSTQWIREAPGRQRGRAALPARKGRAYPTCSTASSWSRTRLGASQTRPIP